MGGLAARSAGLVVGSARNASVAAMTKNLADEYGRDGINVTIVHPGMTVTENLPAGLQKLAAARGSTPEEAQAAMAGQTSIGRLITAEELRISSASWPARGVSP